MYQRNIKSRPRNDCCKGKGINITYSVCVFVALGMYLACNNIRSTI
jgi:hypothetical protein